MKNITCIILLALLAFSCKKEKNCPEGYTGDDCTEEIQPKYFVIKSMSVTAWPLTDINGVAWDFGSNVDLYAKIIRLSSGAVLYTSPVYENAQTGFTQGWPTNIEFAFDDIIYVEIWDDDGGFSEDEYVGFVFAPSWTPGAGFPSIQTVSQDGLTILYDVDYKF